ncbi:hypothetical protein TpMuguga_05g00002 (apicoplast) [Theileria parva strain Muguga]|uniref:Ribosomal protein L4, putative n=1 Tax=Theileria parva TaxID=5875 RepID=Q4MYC1_THEPA|nr:hypothetical protein TpMuguga_05g00002 [Theileria parva strain Muguga]|eukprot:XP_762671.1 ribosomal protein L4 (apicoplast) [Theileria parva strain Muguga]
MFSDNTIFSQLILNIKFGLTIKNKLIYCFNIFINKFLNSNKKILYDIKKNIKNNMFNFRNKLNFNKSKKNIVSKKRTGKSRSGSSSSHTLRKGLLWFGLRNIKLKEKKFNKNLLNSLLIDNKNIITINNLEIIKFIYYITYNNNNLFKISSINTFYLNSIHNYKHLINNKKCINIVY